MLSSALLIAKALENYPVPGTLDNNKAFLLTFLLAQWTDIETVEKVAKQISLSTPQETEMLFCLSEVLVRKRSSLQFPLVQNGRWRWMTGTEIC